MPLYDLECPACRTVIERQVKISERLNIRCECGELRHVRIAPVYGKMAGTVLAGGGPDRFTADTMGIRVGDLPPYLKADRPLPK